MKIRRARPNDSPSVIGLLAQLAGHAHGEIDAGIEDRIGVMLDLPQYVIFVAEDDEKQVIGLLTVNHRWTLWHRGPCALIEELVVDESARGQGVGRALIRAAIDWAEAEGCSEIEVSTEEDNTDAQAFYRGLGFDSTALLLEYEMD